jgi:hypothetical protein
MVHPTTAEMNAALEYRRREPEIDGDQQLGARGVKRRAPLWLKAGFWACIVIAVAAALRRFVALVHPSQTGPSPMAALDAAFASHAALTFAHIISATAFVLVAPLVFLRAPKSGLWERLLFPLGAMVGITAYAMSIPAFGGWVERSAVLLFNSVFLFSMARAYWYAQAGESFQKMRWLSRAVGILLGIATTRPVMGIFFATSRWTHLEPRQFFGVAFWIGFSINTIIVEVWLRSGRRGSAIARVEKLKSI